MRVKIELEGGVELSPYRLSNDEVKTIVEALRDYDRSKVKPNVNVEDLCERLWATVEVTPKWRNPAEGWWDMNPEHTIPAGTNIVGPGFSLLGVSGKPKAKVAVNGQLNRPASPDEGDWYPGDDPDNGDIKFTFVLKVRDLVAVVV